MMQHDRLVWSANLFDASVPEAFGATRSSQRLHKTIKEAQDEAQSWVGNQSISWQPLEEDVSIGLTFDGPRIVVIGEHLPSENIPESKFVWVAILWYLPVRECWQDGTPLTAIELDRLREHGAAWQIRRHQWEIISGRRAMFKVKVSQRLHWLLEDAQAEAQSWLDEFGMRDPIRWGQEGEDHVLVGRNIEGYNIVLRGRFLPD
jgi:hypothetical protein